MTPNRPQKASREPDLLARAALFRLIAQGFHYPTPDLPHVIVTALNRQMAAQPRGALSPLFRALRAARAAWSNVYIPALEAEYTRLYLTGIASPPHETAYGDGRRMAGRTAEIADISGFYLAFGMQLSDREADLPDHLCTELEFYSILLMKQAYAHNQRWMERRRITERAARTFLEDHLGRWVEAFANSLIEQTPPVAYHALARLLVTAVRNECRRLRIRPRLLTGRLAADDMQTEEFVCPHEVGTFNNTPGAGARA